VSAADPRARIFPPLITLIAVVVGIGVQLLFPFAFVSQMVGRWGGGVLIAVALALGGWQCGRSVVPARLPTPGVT